MVPIKGEWTPFIDINDQLDHYRLWGLIPPKSKKLRPIMVVDGYFSAPEPCKVVGYQSDSWAIIELDDGFHAIYGEYLAELQPDACQKLPFGMCFAEILSQYVVLDIETTGFDNRNDRIIEIAAVSYAYGVKQKSFHALINPGKPLPAEITFLTGIKQADLDNAPALAEVEQAFFDFIGEMPVIGHNAVSFDIPFLSAQFSRPIENPVIDTLPMARKVFDLLPRHKLEYLNKVLELGSANSHRAFDDVETTNSLLWACLAPRRYESLEYKAFLDHRIGNHSGLERKKASNAPYKPKNENKGKKPFSKVDIKSIVPSSECVNSSSQLCGKTIVFTGTLSIQREEAMQIAVDAGAILKNAVSRQTEYLVVGKQDITIVGLDGMSTKEEKAYSLNKSGKARIQIISEEEFLKLAKGECISV